MATVKISELAALAGASVVRGSDVLPIVDSVTGTTKKITVADLTLTASYAVSASHEIVYETSSSYADFAASGNGPFSGSFTGSYIGDGSALTGVAAFPFVGDAVITGSLLISGSHAFRVDTDDVIIGAEAGAALDTSATSYNVLIGYQAATTLTTGDQNVYIGYKAGDSVATTAGQSVGIGYLAGHNSAGVNRVSIGSRAGYNNGGGTATGAVCVGINTCWNVAGTDTIAIGSQAIGNSSTAANYSISIGSFAGYEMNGDYNINLGYKAGYNLDGDDNIFIGNQAGEAATTGDNNIIIGNEVEKSAIGASSELKIGSGSLIAISASLVTGDVLFPSTASAAYFSGDGSNLTNVSAFPFTGDAVITGSLTISGSQALQVDTTNVVLGANAGGGSVGTGTDDNNVIIGTDAAGGGGLNSGDSNVILGHSAGSGITTGDDNVIIGSDAASNGAYSGNASVYIGNEAGRSAAGAYYNVVIGDGALYSLTSGDNNVALGRYASYAVATNGDQIHIGYNAGRAATVDKSIAIGSEAGVQAGGAGNTAMGYKALRGGTGWTAITTILQNTAIGYEAGKITIGEKNTFMGYQAAVAATSANSNVIIGNSTAATLTTGDGNIIIGDGVDVLVADSQKELRIGSGSVIAISASLATGDVIFASTASAAYFTGDGSQLTNLPAASPFPLSGSAIISSSYTGGDTNSHVLQLIGSGSVSGSGLFEIQGSSTTLFSVTDDLTDELFAANDTSGLSIISAFADRTVKLGKPGGFGIVISGSDPMPSDEAAKIFITGSTYFSGSFADFSQVGTITGTFPSSGGGGTSVAIALANSWFMG